MTRKGTVYKRKSAETDKASTKYYRRKTHFFSDGSDRNSGRSAIPSALGDSNVSPSKSRTAYVLEFVVAILASS